MNVSGSAEDVKKFITDMSQPIQTFKPKEEGQGYGHVDGEHITEEVVFSFFNIIAPTDLESYFTGDTWYGWNNTNWNTKWDARCDEKTVEDLDQYVTEDGNANVTYRFDTAWSPPMPVYRALAEKYPDLEFDIEWNEEQGFGAELSGSAGELSVIREWDIPESHKDYMERGEDCQFCCYGELDDMADDCPDKVEATENEDENVLIEVTDLRYA